MTTQIDDQLIQDIQNALEAMADEIMKEGARNE